MDRLPRTELTLYDEFRSKAHLYSAPVPPHEDVVSWLAAMQHHRVPTRLLDWSYSAYVALFFAVYNVAEEGFTALWAIHTATLLKTSRKSTKDLFGLPAGAILESPEHFKRIAFHPAFTDDSKGLVVPILPKFQVSRLSSQQGCFLFNCNYLAAFEDSLAAMMQDEKASWLYRILFPSSLRAECLRRLMHFNIHPASLFPDLDGLAQFVTLKNELFPI